MYFDIVYQLRQLSNSAGSGEYLGILLLTCISNHIPSRVWDEITYPCPNFNGCTCEVWEWISFFISHITIGLITYHARINTLRPRQNGRHFADDIFKCIFLHENVSIAIKISLKFVPKGPINNIPALVQPMDWRRPGDKPSSEPIMVSLPTHICVTRPQWVKV